MSLSTGGGGGGEGLGGGGLRKEKDTGEPGARAWPAVARTVRGPGAFAATHAFISLSLQLRIASSPLPPLFASPCHTPAHRVSLRPAFVVSRPKRFNAALYPIPHAALHPRCRDAAQMRSVWLGCIEALHLRVVVATTQRCVVEAVVRVLVVTRRSCSVNASTTTRSCNNVELRGWNRFSAAKLLEPPVYASQGA